MDELPEQKKAGVAAWVMTYADLMSLLMCFFVLLLSFAEIDAERFRELAGELAKAFGVQREVVAKQIPMGSTPVFERFSPGRPQPTTVDQVRQITSENKPRLATPQNPQDERRAQQVKAIAERVQALLAESVTRGRVQVQSEHERIVIRIQEKGTFTSGSAQVLTPFMELLSQMAVVFADIPGIVAVDGHTDNVPLRDGRYGSNWGLSAARASSVANALLENPGLAPERLMVRGFADTQPIDNDDTAKARARNRRVEITIDLGESPEDLGNAAFTSLASNG